MEGAKKKIDKAIVKVITEQINIASASPRCSASVPISSAPIGSNPKNVKVYIPITLPRRTSGTRVCTSELAIFIASIKELPKAKIIMRDNGII